MSPPTYPFVPKSNRFLIPGQFWGIPLSSGQFAAGRVIQVNPQNRTTFLIGLMDWVGPNPPTGEDLAGRLTVRQGEAHYISIVDTGPAVLGHRSLGLDAIEPDLMLSQGSYSGAWIQRGLDRVRPATREEWARLPVFTAWGRTSIKHQAETLFVRGRPLLDHRPDVEAWLRANGGRRS